MFVFLWLLFPVSTLRLHQYNAVEETYLVSQSPNLQTMYACKDDCFKLIDTFPYPMKYDRIVWVQPGTNHVYMEGHCYVDMKSNQSTDNWVQWKNIQQYKIFISQQQIDKWSNFREMSDTLRITLGLTKIHSQYQFYSNGTFINLQEGKVDNLDDLFNQLLSNL